MLQVLPGFTANLSWLTTRTAQYTQDDATSCGLEYDDMLYSDFTLKLPEASVAHADSMIHKQFLEPFRTMNPVVGFLRRNILLVVMVPTVIGMHYGWVRLQQNEKFVPKEEKVKVLGIDVKTIGKSKSGEESSA